jgi:hypothetical protein
VPAFSLFAALGTLAASAGAMPNQKRTPYPVWEADEPSRLETEETAIAYQRDVQLAPSVPESLVTWDVSGHAQCEKDRMNSVYRVRGAMQRGY